MTHVLIAQNGPPSSSRSKGVLREEASDSLMNVSEKVASVSQQYLKLCAEYQMLSKNGYVPRAFESKLQRFSKVESEMLSQADESVRAAYRAATSENRVLDHLNKTKEVEACGRRISVPGDGNCGVHSLAVGVVVNRDQGVLQNLELHLANLPNSADKNRVLEGIAGLHRAEDSERLLRDKNFMHSLARVLRAVGHSEVPKHIERTYGSILTGADHQIIQNLIPERDTVWVEAEGLLALANVLGMKICVDVRGKLGERIHLQGEVTKPDFVIRHQGSHFTPLVK